MTPKQRYFRKKFDEAPMIDCACGCGTSIKSMDRYARPKTFENGHNARKYYGEDASNWSREKRWRVKNPETVAAGKKRFHRKRKVKAIMHKGGSCIHCGLTYDGKNGPKFEFHHEDPEFKEFAVGNRLGTYSWEKILTELEKCVLLCACCHNQHHGGEW